jgi:glucose-6-phosphate 1-dehydrogenase
MSESPLHLVILGASGDLTARKLVPSLFRLWLKKRLPEKLKVVGVSRTPLGDEGFRKKMSEAVKEFASKEWSEDAWNEFATRIYYAQGDAAADGGLSNLKAFLAASEGPGGNGDRLFYFSVMPELYGSILARLDAAGLTTGAPSGGESPWRRIVIEKPFGKNLDSARSLNKAISAYLREDQIYRIDHYLAKETVQNVLVFRFANTLFEPLWNHNYIDHVQITVSEAVTVGNRGDYYDRAGVLRDMFQNHLLQILAVTAMEAPSRYTADLLRNEKVKALDAVTVFEDSKALENLATGQYRGYANEKGVSAGSRTPTYAAIRLQIDNWRWRGVPFYLRSGKGLRSRASEILIQFRCPPHLMFPLPPGSELQCNRLAICIQPQEGIHLNFQTKVPDQEKLVLDPVDMEFSYRKAFSGLSIPESYERLLLDALLGDASLFMRSDEIERSWAIMDPFIRTSEDSRLPMPQIYETGSTGPSSADKLIKGSGHDWIGLYADRGTS